MSAPDDAEGRRAVIVHADDNVATLVDQRVELTRLRDGTPVSPGVPYGHKSALRRIEAGADVVKYGVAIGRATEAIPPGAHVHVHNVADPEAVSA